MGKIAFIYGETFIYWQSIILTLGILTAVCAFLALYLHKSSNGIAAALAVPVALAVSFLLARLTHWYCQSAAYKSFTAAMTDYSSGGYALMGVFAGCALIACLLRLLRIVKDLPEMLDCMTLAGMAGIGVGRLAFLFSASDRGMLLENVTTLPAAWPVVNTVTGATEYRLATFMFQAMAAGLIFLIFLVFWLRGLRRRDLPSGDTALLTLAVYGATQIVLDSTRYDSLFLRSNGFVSVVQILGAAALLTAIILFSVRMVRRCLWRRWFIAIWVGILALLVGAGYMEYYVQRHGDQALFAYSIMSLCLAGVIGLIILIRCLAVREICRKPISESDNN